MRILLALSLVLSSLTGCAVYTPAGSVVVDPGSAGSQGQGGSFCPPGQAKKGRC